MNMKSQKTLQILVLSGVLCSAAFCSEEDIHTPYKLSLWTDAGKPFGNVSATIECTDPSSTYPYKPIFVKSITLIVKNKTYIVPQSSLKDLQNPLIHTAEFRTMGARDGGSPWLCFVLRLDNPKAKTIADRPQVYIRFRDGRLQTTQVWPAK